MKQFNFVKGRGGEGIARKYLEEKGFELVETNHINYMGEIDLVMIDKNELVFVEVKLKTSDDWGSPEEMVSRGKLNRVMRVATAFLSLRPDVGQKFKKYRIDVVCINSNANLEAKNVRHYRGVF